MSIRAVVEQLQGRIDALPLEAAHRALFMRTYLRTTVAVGDTLRRGGFEDRDWVEQWDVVFAGFFLRAHDAAIAGRSAEVPRPWQLAFSTPAEAHPLQQLLLGMNAHINYDLPQSLLAMISDRGSTTCRWSTGAVVTTSGSTASWPRASVRRTPSCPAARPRLCSTGC